MAQTDLGLNKRIRLQRMLTDILGTTGQTETRTYYQPPSADKMKYPAIIYSLNKIQNRYADNLVYSQTNEYQLIVVDYNPDNEIVRAVSLLPRCRHDRRYKADNLYHDAFTIYI